MPRGEVKSADVAKENFSLNPCLPVPATVAIAIQVGDPALEFILLSVTVDVFPWTNELAVSVSRRQATAKNLLNMLPKCT